MKHPHLNSLLLKMWKIGKALIICFFKNGPFPASFSLFSSLQYTVDRKQMFNNFLPMTGFKPRTSGIRSDRSTNWATQPLPLIIGFLSVIKNQNKTFPLSNAEYVFPKILLISKCFTCSKLTWSTTHLRLLLMWLWSEKCIFYISRIV